MFCQPDIDSIDNFCLSLSIFIEFLNRNEHIHKNIIAPYFCTLSKNAIFKLLIINDTIL